MELSGIESIAEIAGSIATVLTLIYVGIQIKNNTMATRRAALGEVIDRQARWMTSLRENPDSMAVFLKGGRDYTSLSAEESFKYHLVLGEVFAYYASTVEEGATWGVKQETIEAAYRHMKEQMRAPGARAWWRERGRSDFSRDFAELVDDLIDD
jgi:hypothetical protein